MTTTTRDRGPARTEARPDPAPPGPDVRARLMSARSELADSMVERDEEVGLCLTALVAREHVLLVGPPGAGKSMLLDGLVGLIRGRSFSALLTKFTMPDELFGPLDITALQSSRYRRNTANRLPEAHIAYLDEIWKASSAILNTLIRCMNERQFENDGAFLPIPLRMLLASSNEYPSAEGGQELGAMLDRFVFRSDVAYVSTRAGQERLFDWDNRLKAGVGLSVSVSPDEVDRAHAEAVSLPWSEEAKEAMRAVVAGLKAEGVVPGDRRKHKAVTAARAAAYLAGADLVRPEHLDVLRYVLWDQPGDQAKKCGEVVGRVANPDGMQIRALRDEADALLAVYEPRSAQSREETDAKLTVIGGKLRRFSGHPKADQTLAYLREEVREIKRATAAAIQDEAERL